MALKAVMGRLPLLDGAESRSEPFAERRDAFAVAGNMESLHAFGVIRKDFCKTPVRFQFLRLSGVVKTEGGKGFFTVPLPPSRFWNHQRGML